MFRFSSKKELNSELKCTIRLLDELEVLECEFTKENNGQFLLDFCYKNLNVLEKDYFGLRYVDTHKQRNWLDPTRPIYKQTKGISPIVFCFRIKFYPIDVNLLKDEVTRYHLYLQLRRDLLHGRLYCPSLELAYLMACILQSELGDFDSSQHGPNYITDLKLIINQSSKPLLDEAKRIHQTELVGLTPPEVETLFLKKACQMETYGVDPHQVKDHKGNQLFIGVNHSGMMTFQGNRKTHHFKWSEIRKVTYEGRVFIVHLIINDKKNYVGFKCPTIAACHYLWRCCVEQRYFFTMSSSNDVPSVTTCGGFFTKQCKLHYSGRVQRDIINDMHKKFIAAKNEEKSTLNNITQESNSNSNVQRSASTCSAPGTIRTLGRSNTIHFGYADLEEKSTEKPIEKKNEEDEDFKEIEEDDEYGAEEMRNVTPNFGSNIIHRHTSGTILQNGKNLSHVQRSQSAAAAPIVFSNHRLNTFNDDSLKLSFTTEFNMQPDITPTEEEKNQIQQKLQDQENLRQKLGSYNIQNPELLFCEKPVVKPSPSHIRNSELDLSISEDKTDYDPIPKDYYDDSLENEFVDSKASKNFLNQRSDSSAKRKLIRQKASINEVDTNNFKPSKIQGICFIVKISILSLILMFFLLGLLMVLIFELDSEILDQHRQSNELIILKEEFYNPLKKYFLSFFTSKILEDQFSQI